ncbi:MAG: hypothetical protein KF805_08845 [Phycisphaeraceae bacterium]|nr:hypothetical protein [Phycisphaeraceae bacterium]
MESTVPSWEIENAGATLKSCAAEFDDAFHRATRKTGTRHEQFFSIARRRVKLTFASDALAAQLTPALEHVRTGPGPVELEVALWEGRDEVPPPLPPAWEQARYFPRGRVEGMQHPDLRLVVLPGLGSLSLIDLAASRGWYCAREAGRVAYWESACPLRNMLHAWLARRNVFVLHAAAIGCESGGALLVGKGGSGKSTTSLVGLEAGMLYLGDDCCLGEIVEGRPTLHACYCSAKVCNDALPRLDGLDMRLGNPHRTPDEKAVLFLGGTHSAQLPQHLPLRAILLPKIAADRAAGLEPVTPGQALASLSPSTMMQLADADHRDLAFHAELARTVPAYRLFLNDDRAAIVGAMKSVLS